LRTFRDVLCPRALRWVKTGAGQVSAFRVTKLTATKYFGQGLAFGIRARAKLCF
jgi:hypothetical protein